MPVTHCTDGWVSPSAVLDFLEKKGALVPYRISTHDLTTSIVVTITNHAISVPILAVGRGKYTIHTDISHN